MKRNGILQSEWARGRIVAAADGIEICSSFVGCCEACMERKVQRRVGEEFCEDLQYYHRLCALTVVSTPFPIPLGIRFQKNGESEVACTLALLEDLIERLGRRFFDLLVADALYLQKPFVEAVEALGLDWVINRIASAPFRALGAVSSFRRKSAVRARYVSPQVRLQLQSTTNRR